MKNSRRGRRTRRGRVEERGGEEVEQVCEWQRRCWKRMEEGSRVAILNEGCGRRGDGFVEAVADEGEDEDEMRWWVELLRGSRSHSRSQRQMTDS